MVIATWLLGCNGDDTTTPPEHSTPIEDTGPELVTDLFAQDMITPVDILWVLDRDFDLVGNLPDAIDPMWEVLLLADPSWQMGVLDASAGGNRYALLTKVWGSWPPPNGAFTVGTPAEAARFDETVYSALALRSNAPENKEFRRSGASLYTVYVTEAEDASDREVVSVRDFADWYASLSSTARIGVITSSDGRNYWRDRTVGASIFEVGSEKAAVRGAILEAIGLEVTFELTNTPSEPPREVEVIYRDHATIYELDQDYTWSAPDNTISFKRVIPPPDSTVRVIYALDGATPAPTTAD
jgi:hypothetical protein